MSRLLIVNADDFGLCKAQTYGIIDAFTHGVVTSTTALVNAAGSEHAASLSAAHPGLAVGLHFVLTLGRPLTAIPGLVGDDGELNKGFWHKAKGTLPLDEIAQELNGQFDRFIQLFGRQPSHIDSHHHVHMHPALFPLVAAFTREKGVGLRIDRMARPPEENPARSTQGFDSSFYGNDITETRFLQTLDRAVQRDEQSLEVMCHPAFVDNILLSSNYCYPRLAELTVLTAPSLKAAIAERGFRLGSYRDL